MKTLISSLFAVALLVASTGAFAAGEVTAPKVGATSTKAVKHSKGKKHHSKKAAKTETPAAQ
jgi:hypothetical protein